jgi:hypothetical protein
MEQVTPANGQAYRTHRPLGKLPCVRLHQADHCSTQTISTQARKVFALAAKDNRRKPLSAPRKMRSGHEKYAAEQLWARKWCTVFVDEAHYFRGPGALFHGLNAFCMQAQAIVLTTATPLYNGPKVHSRS